jgi:hypothetical protein
MKKILFALCVLTLPAAHAADNNYRFSLQHQATLNGTQLKPGDYRIQVDGDKATVRLGKTVIEAPVKVESADRKFQVTTVGLEGTGNNLRISEIAIGGSTTRIVFSGTSK